jgi:hypothetical protein
LLCLYICAHTHTYHRGDVREPQPRAAGAACRHRTEQPSGGCAEHRADTAPQQRAPGKIITNAYLLRCSFVLKMPSFYQDRLGTYLLLGKAALTHERCAFRFLQFDSVYLVLETPYFQDTEGLNSLVRWTKRFLFLRPCLYSKRNDRCTKTGSGLPHIYTQTLTTSGNFRTGGRRRRRRPP